MKKEISLPSQSIEVINVPEVKNVTYQCVYNYYTEDEQINYPKIIDTAGKTIPYNQLPRYVNISWKSPRITTQEIEQDSAEKDQFLAFSLSKNAAIIISEDNFFNDDYFNHTFSNISKIEKGITDLEYFSRLSNNKDESIFKMANKVIEQTDYLNDNEYANAIKQLSNFPEKFLGFSVDSANTNDTQVLFNFNRDASIKGKINFSIASDFFEKSSLKKSSDFFNKLRGYALKISSNKSKSKSFPATQSKSKSTTSYIPAYITGYIVTKYSITNNVLKKEKDIYVESATQTNIQDKEIKYGNEYVYSIKSVYVVSLDIPDGNGGIETLKLLVASRPVSVNFIFEERTSPPPPNNLQFFYDKSEKRLVLTWDMPVNHQSDIKQFQVMRRDNINSAFEMVHQVTFDNTQGIKSKTGEIIDANYDVDVPQEYQKYITRSMYPVQYYYDYDFSVINFISPDYIYAVCSIDAHGFISNYSDQFRIKFDVYENQLKIEHIANSGAYRQYPNLTLKEDAFIDSIYLSGEDKQITIHAMPDQTSILDKNKKIPAIQINQINDKKSGYVFQIINIDNQKSKLISVKLMK